MPNVSELLSLTQKYFVQQAELYGADFSLDVDLTSRAGTADPETLESFNARIENCQKCGLAKNRTRFVFGTGNPRAALMCIGEAPGHDEDRAGEPFVGAAGQLLNCILAAIDFQRDEVYIANIIKCRPPRNRDPEPDEVSQCMPYLRQQIAMVRPRVILVLGRVAAQTMLGTPASLGSLRGTIHDFEGIKVIATYHPAALLRNPQWKRGTWEDIQCLRQTYDELVGDKPPLESKDLGGARR